MRLVFIYGGPAAGKYTVARKLSELSGLPLFHNHLVVDAVHAVFEFGSEPFRRLREQFWMDVFEAAISDKQSLIFTFQPENSVSADFPVRVRGAVENGGGQIDFVRLVVSPSEQEARIGEADRANFGKLRNLQLLRELRTGFQKSEAAMPRPAITINTDATLPEAAAAEIAAVLKLT